MTLSDGTTWTSRGNQLDGNQGQSVIWSKELTLLVAVSQNGTNRVATSSDGITWTTLPVSENVWNDIERSPTLGLFVAVADSGTGNRVMTSSDGCNWTDRSITDRSWETIRWSGDLGIFLAVAKDGYIATSSGWITWNESELTGDLRGCCWSSELGAFVIVGYSNVVYSTSLKERKPTSDNVFNSEFNSIDEEGNWTLKSLTTAGNVDVGGDVSITGTQINFNSDSFISNTAGGTSGNHLIIFIN